MPKTAVFAIVFVLWCLSHDLRVRHLGHPPTPSEPGSSATLAPPLPTGPSPGTDIPKAELPPGEIRIVSDVPSPPKKEKPTPETAVRQKTDPTVRSPEASREAWRRWLEKNAREKREAEARKTETEGGLPYPPGLGFVLSRLGGMGIVLGFLAVPAFFFLTSKMGGRKETPERSDDRTDPNVPRHHAQTMGRDFGTPARPPFPTSREAARPVSDSPFPKNTGGRLASVPGDGTVPGEFV